MHQVQRVHHVLVVLLVNMQIDQVLLHVLLVQQVDLVKQKQLDVLDVQQVNMQLKEKHVLFVLKEHIHLHHGVSVKLVLQVHLLQVVVLLLVKNVHHLHINHVVDKIIV
jgi:hypothetical protein